VELKDKVGAFASEDMEGAVETEAPKDDGITGEAVKALMSLGYEMEEIAPIMKKLAGSYTNVSALVSAALREFARNRE
jgi:Holliday junction DNA helicase RuvA